MSEDNGTNMVGLGCLLMSLGLLSPVIAIIVMVLVALIMG